LTSTFVFVDSGGWIGLLKRDDADHEACAAPYAELSADRSRFVTSNYVLDETATRLRYDVGLQAALGFRAILAEAIRSGRLQLTWVDERIENEAWALLERHAALPISLTDATSAAIAKKHRLVEFFGLDRHFEALGFTVLPG
jgi:uncharacterized protein